MGHSRGLALVFWLVMVSTAMAVLPVCRSPMTSSRWSRPMWMSAFTALRPVSMGSDTDSRGMMPGALTSAREHLQASRPAPPSMGWPMPSTTRPRISSLNDSAGPLDGVPLEDVDVVAKDDHPDVVLLEVEGHAAEAAGEDDHLPGLDAGQAVDAGNAVAHGDDGADLGVLDGPVLSSGRGGDLGLEVGGELEGLGGQAAAGAEGRGTDRLGMGEEREERGRQSEICRVRPKRRALRK